MTAGARIMTAMIKRSSLHDGRKRPRLVAKFAGCCSEKRDLIACAFQYACIAQVVADAMRIVGKRPTAIAVAPADAWQRITAQYKSAA